MVMKDWDLPGVFQAIHQEVVLDLETSRRNLKHPGDKGDATEQVWIDLLNNYLPRRYQVTRGHVVDSRNRVSDQIDLIIFDRQYSPFIFTFKKKIFVPAESVYAIFEVKQDVKTKYIEYAKGKLKSVRNLYRTSIPVQTINGTQPAKPLHDIIGGFLALDSKLKIENNSDINRHFAQSCACDRFNIGCIATLGAFSLDKKTGEHELRRHDAAVTDFLLDLTRQLQPIATVPALDIDAYRQWLQPPNAP